MVAQFEFIGFPLRYFFPQLSFYRNIGYRRYFSQRLSFIGSRDTAFRYRFIGYRDKVFRYRVVPPLLVTIIQIIVTDGLLP